MDYTIFINYLQKLTGIIDIKPELLRDDDKQCYVKSCILSGQFFNLSVSVRHTPNQQSIFYFVFKSNNNHQQFVISTKVDSFFDRDLQRAAERYKEYEVSKVYRSFIDDNRDNIQISYYA